MRPKYKNKHTGEILEYDSFMGMWYTTDKNVSGELKPYCNYELKDNPNWEEIYE